MKNLIYAIVMFIVLLNSCQNKSESISNKSINNHQKNDTQTIQHILETITSNHYVLDDILSNFDTCSCRPCTKDASTDTAIECSNSKGHYTVYYGYKDSVPSKSAPSFITINLTFTDTLTISAMKNKFGNYYIYPPHTKREIYNFNYTNPLTKKKARIWMFEGSEEVHIRNQE